MTFDELNKLADTGVFLLVSAADLREVIKDIAPQEKMPLTAPKCGLNLKQAAKVYGHDEKTMRKWLVAGIYQGIKTGGVWSIETPTDRHKRITNNK